MRKLKKALAFLLTVAMLVSLFPTVVFADGEETTEEILDVSGTLSSGVTWHLYGDTLTFSGSGTMVTGNTSSNVSQSPWEAYDEEIVHVIIESGVTSIGSAAFWGCSNLLSIEIPNSVRSIEYWAFVYCSKMTEINLSEDHPYFTIYNGAIYSKDRTTLYVYLPANTDVTHEFAPECTTIKAQAFYAAQNIEYINWPTGNDGIGTQVFQNCTNLKRVRLPDGAKWIWDRAFEGCNNIEKLYLPKSLTTITRYAFLNSSTPTIYYAGLKSDWEKVSIECWGNGVLLCYELFSFASAETSATVSDALADNESAVAAADVASGTVVAAAESSKDAFQTAVDNAVGGGDLTATELKVELTDYSETGATYDITPQVTVENTDDSGATYEETVALDLDGVETEVTIPITPEQYTQWQDDEITAVHLVDGNASKVDVYEEDGTYYASFTTDNGFSEYELTSETPVYHDAALTTLTDTVIVGESVSVNVNITHEEENIYAAGEVVLAYDAEKLTFNETESELGSATVKDEDGTLTIEDYGTDKNLGNGVYTVVFDTSVAGSAEISLVSAAFVDKEDAVKRDLIAATIPETALTVTINKQTFAVTLPDIFEGPNTATDGESYTFSVADGKNYDYDTVTATIDGEAVTVIDNGDGTYTIERVDGDLVISGSRTEKTYQVSFAGNAGTEVTDGADTATYNTDYSFTMPAVENWAYSIDSITIGGVEYNGYSRQDDIVTIPGAAINGDIVITISKAQTVAFVKVEGSGTGATTGYETIVEFGEDYTLTITPEAGYSYTVSATIDGEEVEVIDNGDNTYTVKNVDGNLEFTVEQSVILDGVTVTKYLTLDGTNMWLVQHNIVLASNKVFTYDAQNMFWSEKYNTYCYLVIAETFNADDAKSMIDISDGRIQNISYDMDVNKTGKVDASDAQLTYNMYNTMYGSFTSDATMEKFLRADVNGDTTVDIMDATAIITSILS